MSVEALFSFKTAFKKDMHHSWSFNIMLEVIRTCLTLLGIIGLNPCQEKYHTQAEYCQNPSVKHYSCCFVPYFDYTLCIKMWYSFIAFVSFLVLFDGGWDVSGPLPGKRFPSFAKVCPPLCLVWSEALNLLVNSEISVVYPQLGCKVHWVLPWHVWAKAQQGCNYLRLGQHFILGKKYLPTYRKGIERATPCIGKPVYTHPLKCSSMLDNTLMIFPQLFQRSYLETLNNLSVGLQDRNLSIFVLRATIDLPKSTFTHVRYFTLFFWPQPMLNSVPFHALCIPLLRPFHTTSVSLSSKSRT